MKRFFGFIFLLVGSSAALVSCSSDDEPINSGRTAYEQEIVDYFKEVALGFEFGQESQVTRKWNQEMRLFVGGTPDQVLRSELEDVVSEINELTLDGFQITITTDTAASNSYIFFGTAEDFVTVFPPAENNIDDNWGLFYVSFDGNNNLFRSVVFIDIMRNTDKKAQRHILREELTQSLGLAKDSQRYSASIFQQGWTTVTEYAPIDRALIKLLYSPEIIPGLDSTQVTPILQVLVKQLDV